MEDRLAMEPRTVDRSRTLRSRLKIVDRLEVERKMVIDFIEQKKLKKKLKKIVY